MKRSLTIIAAGFISSSAIGHGLSSDAPTPSFCLIGAELGLPAGKYTVNDIPGCSSPPRPVTPTVNAAGLQNTLAFYALGDFGNPNQLDRITLMLNVNVRSEAKAAYPLLQRAALQAAARLLGDNFVPKGIEAAVLSGGTHRWKVKTWEVEVKRTDWRPNSNGHQVTVRFTPLNPKP
ncbi:MULTISPECIES: hypothetical protein [unclassified Acidovorax]|uniref:hypothetical protein n=1 Tax=unclassified Acidovorax TaxID=2684926 RepID=UPI0028830332|nr:MULTISPECIES: hypothetical protein [unclassified Acidovorax]